jgi:hypothetical protein
MVIVFPALVTFGSLSNQCLVMTDGGVIGGQKWSASFDATHGASGISQ